MQYSLSNGKDHVYQWDKDIIITIQEPEDVPEVHFRWGGKGVPLPVTNQQVEIPVELLQLPKPIVLWAYTPDHTMDMAQIPLEPRPKPADYVHTPTEIKTWEELDERIKALEDGGSVAGVSSVNGKSGNVTLDADDVGAVSTVNGERGAVKTAFYATAIQNGSECSVSPTPKKIYDAYAAGYSVYCQADYTIMDGLTLTLPLVLAVENASTYILAFSTVGALNATSAPMTLVVAFDGNTWGMWITEGVKSDSKLPNPKELVVTLNGVRYAYDGEYRMQLPEINIKSLNVTGASVGQTVKISAVDDNGVPTAWVPVDMASGDAWEKIGEVTLEEAASAMTIQLSKEYKKIFIWARHKYVASTNYSYFQLRSGGKDFACGNQNVTSSWYVFRGLFELFGDGTGLEIKANGNGLAAGAASIAALANATAMEYIITDRTSFAESVSMWFMNSNGLFDAESTLKLWGVPK